MVNSANAMIRKNNNPPPLVAVFALICVNALAFSALQVDAAVSRGMSQTGGVVTAWISTRGGVVAAPCLIVHKSTLTPISIDVADW